MNDPTPPRLGYETITPPLRTSTARMSPYLRFFGGFTGAAIVAISIATAAGSRSVHSPATAINTAIIYGVILAVVFARSTRILQRIKRQRLVERSAVTTLAAGAATAAVCISAYFLCTAIRPTDQEAAEFVAFSASIACAAISALLVFERLVPPT